MTDYERRSRWMFAIGALLLAAVAGGVAYNMGVSHGLAQTAIAQGTAPPYAWGYRPYSFGFGFPFLFVLFWILLFRGLFWGGPWRRRWYYDGPHGDPRDFDDWHRRAHERMKPTSASASAGKESPSADDSRGGR
jgi:hypothetical protein